MTTVEMHSGGYTTRATVDQSPAELETMALSTGIDHCMVYSPLISHHDGRITWAASVFNREAGRVEYTGGRFYVGLGAALGCETTATIGPHLRLFRIVAD